MSDTGDACTCAACQNERGAREYGHCDDLITYGLMMDERRKPGGVLDYRTSAWLLREGPSEKTLETVYVHFDDRGGVRVMPYRFSPSTDELYAAHARGAGAAGTIPAAGRSDGELHGGPDHRLDQPVDGAHHHLGRG